MEKTRGGTDVKESLEKRNVGADVIRSLAFFLVVCVHFFLNNGFYQNTVLGERMLVMTLMRSFFIICVPLFMMLSGFLMRQKALSKGYYKKLSKTLLTYVLAGVFCLLYAVLFQEKTYTLGAVVRSFFAFEAAPYAWYIEMYVGLFLLVPFLNVLWNNLPSRRAKQTLLLVLVILTALPALFNAHDPFHFTWLSKPSEMGEALRLLPDWWTGIYPLTYYFLGCYFHEYGCKMNRLLNAGLILATTLVSGAYAFWRSIGTTFVWGKWCDYLSVFNVALTALVFVFFLNLDYSRLPRAVLWLLRKVSALSLGAYLLSWIFDQAFYPILNARVPQMTDRLEYFFLLVPTVAVSSLLLSQVLSWVQRGARWLLFLPLRHKQKDK